jgi:hypothetical protein
MTQPRNKNYKMNYSDKYCTSILLDTTFNISAITFWSNKVANTKLTIEEISNMLENKGDCIRFANFIITKTGVDERNGKSTLSLNSIYNIMYNNITLGIDETSVHPLEQQYGKRGLKLSKISYCRYTTDTNIEIKDVNEAATVVKFWIDYVEFRIQNESGETTGTLHLTAKELFKYILPIRLTPKESVSEYFYEYSCLNMFNLTYGIPTVELVPYSFLKYDEDIKLELSTKTLEQLDNWTNKMSILGQHVETNGIVLLKHTGTYEKLSVPNVLFIELNAFSDSPVNELLITSPDTIMYNPDGNFTYTNKYGKTIKMTKAYDKKLEKQLLFSEIDDKLKMCILMNGFGTLNLDLGIYPFVGEITVTV